jgi:hypothetical protein
MEPNEIPDREMKERKPRVVITEEVMKSVCEQVAVGDSLEKVCSMPDMPTSRAVRLHVLKNAQAAALLHEARKQQTMWRVDELVGIADDPSLDPRRAKNAINVRTWLLERLLPALYAGTAKLQVETVPKEPSLLEHETLLQALLAIWGPGAPEALRVEVDRIRRGEPVTYVAETIMKTMRPELRQALQAAFGADALDRLSEALRRATGEVLTVKAVAA